MNPKVRSFSRNWHRDIAYFFVGLILSFSISGIALNHRRTHNPREFTYNAEPIKVNMPADPEAINEEFVQSLIPEIEKAIRNSDLGFNPQNDGEQIIINIPQLTEERRVGLVKQAKTVTEDGKISVRNARKEANDELKQLLKDGAPEDAIKGAEEEVQRLTDAYAKKMDELLAHKEGEIMTV